MNGAHLARQDMERDIRITVLVTAEEYMAAKHMAGEDGDSQSGLLRRLLLKEARRRASSLAQEFDMGSAEPAQVVRKGAA